MKITTTQLRRLIAEEVRRLVEGDRVESFVDDPGRREPLDSSLRRMPFKVEEGPEDTGGSIRLTLGSFSVVMSPEDAGELGEAVGGEVVDPSEIHDTLSGKSYVVGVERHPDGGVTLSFTDSFAASQNRRAAAAFNKTLSAPEAAVLADLLQAVGMDA
jgi:hypothetical protein